MYWVIFIMQQYLYANAQGKNTFESFPPEETLMIQYFALCKFPTTGDSALKTSLGVFLPSTGE